MRGKGVALAVAGPQRQLQTTRSLNLAPQAACRVVQIAQGERRLLLVQMHQQGLPSDCLAWRFTQCTQQSHLGMSQIERNAVGGVQSPVFGMQPPALLGGAGLAGLVSCQAAEHAMTGRFNDFQGAELGQIDVGARMETEHLIVIGIQRRQHHDARRVARILGADPLRNVQSAGARQRHVQ